MALKARFCRTGVLLLALGAVSSATRAQVSSTAPDLNETTIDALQDALRSRRLTCRQVIDHYLRRIDAYDQRGPALNAIVTVNATAVAEANRLDVAMRTSGPTGSLHCVPVLVKDAFETSGIRTTYGSAAFKDFVPARDATVVARLRQAGALILAKATLGEFASGYAGSISGPIRSPYDLRRHPSGSSGGTGAGMSADFAVVGIGGDTGGSVRGPAAVGSLVGLRPTTALVSRHGSVPFKPTYDAVGPLTRTVRDAALVMSVIAGYDPEDPLTAYAAGRVPASFTAPLTREALKGVRLGIVRRPMARDTDTLAPDSVAIRAVFRRAVEELRTAGAVLIDDVSVEDVGERTRRSYEANLQETEAALDNYLHQLPNAPFTTMRALVNAPGALLPWRAKALRSLQNLSTDDASYLPVLKNNEDTRRAVLSLMATHQLDGLVYPSSDHYPTLIAPDITTNPDVLGDTRRGSNRTLASIVGFPAVTVPAGLTTDQMPVGLEFMGRAFDDAKILGYAFAYEQATHHRRPPPTTPRLPR
jgi:Asp-tRNA(Asn)/Glu-tRNA(Gln) amidotransferase A subunit family amidase